MRLAQPMGQNHPSALPSHPRRAHFQRQRSASLLPMAEAWRVSSREPRLGPHLLGMRRKGPRSPDLPSRRESIRPSPPTTQRSGVEPWRGLTLSTDTPISRVASKQASRGVSQPSPIHTLPLITPPLMYMPKPLKKLLIMNSPKTVSSGRSQQMSLRPSLDLFRPLPYPLSRNQVNPVNIGSYRTYRIPSIPYPPSALSIRESTQTSSLAHTEPSRPYANTSEVCPPDRRQQFETWLKLIERSLPTTHSGRAWWYAYQERTLSRWTQHFALVSDHRREYTVTSLTLEQIFSEPPALDHCQNGWMIIYFSALGENSWKNTIRDIRNGLRELHAVAGRSLNAAENGLRAKHCPTGDQKNSTKTVPSRLKTFQLYPPGQTRIVNSRVAWTTSIISLHPWESFGRYRKTNPSVQNPSLQVSCGISPSSRSHSHREREPSTSMPSKRGRHAVPTRYRKYKKLYGKLLHAALIIPAGRAYLMSLEQMLGIFNDRPFLPRTPPKGTTSDLNWWKRTLSSQHLARTIPGLCTVHEFFAYSDASSGHGIGIVINGRWRAWDLLPGWQSEGRDIGWAESVGFELLVLTILDSCPPGIHFKVYGDNRGVVEGWWTGRSRSRTCNEIFKQIHNATSNHKCTVLTRYVPSKGNPADGPSRGIYPPSRQMLPPVPIPTELRPFIANISSSTADTRSKHPRPPGKQVPPMVEKYDREEFQRRAWLNREFERRGEELNEASKE